MEAKKIILVLMSAFLFCITPVFAQVTDDSHENLSQEDIDRVANSAKEVLEGLKSFAGKTKKSLDKQVQKLGQKAVTGRWEFINGDCKTTILVHKDYTMQIIQEQGSNYVTYRGGYAVSEVMGTGSLIFNVFVKDTRSTFSRKNEDVSATWNISYSIKNGEVLLASIPDLPDDNNGYSFKKITAFTRMEEKNI